MRCMVIISDVSNLSYSSKQRVRVRCDYQVSPNCKDIYEIRYDAAFQNLTQNNNIKCVCCSRYKVKKFGHKLYDVWRAMFKRCYNPKCQSYKDYGKRGIKVCKEWHNNFSSFKIWAIDNGYKEDLEIDRINNDGNYNPNNCRFVTVQQNAMNRRGKSNTTSKYKGVFFDKNSPNKWRAKISKGGKHFYLGYFSTENEAAQAYNDKAVELHRKYAYLNKIEND